MFGSAIDFLGKGSLVFYYKLLIYTTLSSLVPGGECWIDWLSCRFWGLVVFCLFSLTLLFSSFFSFLFFFFFSSFPHLIFLMWSMKGFWKLLFKSISTLSSFYSYHLNKKKVFVCNQYFIWEAEYPPSTSIFGQILITAEVTPCLNNVNVSQLPYGGKDLTQCQWFRLKRSTRSYNLSPILREQFLNKQTNKQINTILMFYLNQF